MSSIRTCKHIKVTGVRCGSPALRGEEYCYFHQRMIRGIKGPRSRLSQVALLENEEAIQVSIMEVVNSLLSGTIELKRGELVLRALNTAVRNSRRTRFENVSDMIRELPEVHDPDPATAAASTYATSLATAHVGTTAPGCPGGPDVPVRSAIENGGSKPPVGVKKIVAPARRKNAVSP